jgi:hypothetical protein
MSGHYIELLLVKMELLSKTLLHRVTLNRNTHTCSWDNQCSNEVINIRVSKLKTYSKRLRRSSNSYSGFRRFIIMDHIHD